VSRLSLIKVFLGSLFLQASWNFEKMQGLGFAAALAPAIDDIYGGDEAAAREARARHLVYFNTHPIMASAVLGATVRLEEKVRAGELAPETAASFKKKVMGPYGAIGDSLFWRSIRPLASIIGIIATLAWGVWGPVVFLVVYNALHLSMRWKWLERGYALGTGVVSYIGGLGLPRWAIRGRYLASALLGAVAAVWAGALTAALTGAAPGSAGFAWRFFAAVALVAASSALVGLLLRKGLSVSWLIYIAVLPLAVAGAVAHYIL